MKFFRQVKKSEKQLQTLSHFISEPPVSAALLVFALIALFLAIVEFSEAVNY